jgi:IS1 transposase
VIPAAQHRAISKLARKTNHLERFNNTLRQRVSRLVREALSFSKKLANHIGAIKLFICHYNPTTSFESAFGLSALFVREICPMIQLLNLGDQRQHVSNRILA